jgi:hypothetical protein
MTPARASYVKYMASKGRAPECTPEAMAEFFARGGTIERLEYRPVSVTINVYGQVRCVSQMSNSLSGESIGDGGEWR